MTIPVDMVLHSSFVEVSDSLFVVRVVVKVRGDPSDDDTVVLVVVVCVAKLLNVM